MSRGSRAGARARVCPQVAAGAAKAAHTQRCPPGAALLRTAGGLSVTPDLSTLPLVAHGEWAGKGSPAVGEARPPAHCPNRRVAGTQGDVFLMDFGICEAQEKQQYMPHSAVNLLVHYLMSFSMIWSPWEINGIITPS